jgi:putative hydrolase
MEIQGDYHTHTDNSDGKATIEQMVHAAKSAGLREVAITDHGPNKLFGGIKPKQYSMLKALVEKCGEKNEIRALFGVEANITGSAGQIDFKCDEDGALVDILLCGFHRIVRPANIINLFTFFIPNWFYGLIRYTPEHRMRKNTEAVKRALMENRVDVYVHPNRYFKVDVVDIAKVCAERGTLIELNSKKISFRPIDFERMLAAGAKFIICSDAHTPRRIGSVGKVADFLKLCDWNESDIINLKGTFKRGTYGGIKIEKIEKIEEINDIHPKNKKRNRRERKHKK